MESLSKEKNLILGLLLGMALAVALLYAQPSELRASEEVAAVTEFQAMNCTGMQRLDPSWMDYGTISLQCN